MMDNDDDDDDYMGHFWFRNLVGAYRKNSIKVNDTWQPGWEGSLGENGYMYMYG